MVVAAVRKFLRQVIWPYPDWKRLEAASSELEQKRTAARKLSKELKATDIKKITTQLALDNFERAKKAIDDVHKAQDKIDSLMAETKLANRVSLAFFILTILWILYDYLPPILRWWLGIDNT